MKLVVAITFALLAVTKADVSHLTKNYLPPLQQSYSSPSLTYTTSQVQPVNEYLPPVSRPSYATTTFTQSVPATVDTTYTSTGFSGPSLVALSSPSFQPTYTAPTTDYLPPVQQTYSVPSVQQTYSVPSVQTTYTGPSLQSVPTYAFTTSGGGAGAGAGVGAGSSFAASDNVGTQYSSNGGYVYKKK